MFRCVEYLEAKVSAIEACNRTIVHRFRKLQNAECEEGIFRLSGSANVIRVLKDRFNAGESRLMWRQQRSMSLELITAHG